MLSYTGN